MTKISNNKPILITTGGTGGHFFPAQALREDLEKLGHTVVFVTDQRTEPYLCNRSKNTYILHLTSPRSFIQKIRQLFDLIIQTFRSIWILMIRKPYLVISFGGYTTVPMTLASILLRKPLVLHEQNAFIGRVSKWFAPFAFKISCCFVPLYGLSSQYQSKLVHTANPIRLPIQQVASIPYKVFGPNDPIKIVAVGGSQGAKIFSTLIPQAIETLPTELRQRLEIIQQTHESMIDSVQDFYKKIGVKATLAPFFTNMEDLYKTAHLFIARSGASTVLELMTLKRPAIFIPFPRAMDDHQIYNARSATKQKASWIVFEDNYMVGNLAALLKDLFTHPDLLEKAVDQLHTQRDHQKIQSLVKCIEDWTRTTNV